jgi:hypothetical protein
LGLLVTHLGLARAGVGGLLALGGGRRARAPASSAAFSAASAASSACIRSPQATASYWAA